MMKPPTCASRLHDRGSKLIARMLAFDFEPGGEGVAPRLRRAGLVMDARAAGGSRGGALPRPFEPIQRDLGSAIAAVWALYESTFRDACVMDWTQAQASMELTARLQVISLGQQKRGRG